MFPSHDDSHSCLVFFPGPLPLALVPLKEGTTGGRKEKKWKEEGEVDGKGRREEREKKRISCMTPDLCLFLMSSHLPYFPP